MNFEIRNIIHDVISPLHLHHPHFTQVPRSFLHNPVSGGKHDQRMAEKKSGFIWDIEMNSKKLNN